MQVLSEAFFFDPDAGEMTTERPQDDGWYRMAAFEFAFALVCIAVSVRLAGLSINNFAALCFALGLIGLFASAESCINARKAIRRNSKNSNPAR